MSPADKILHHLQGSLFLLVIDPTAPAITHKTVGVNYRLLNSGDNSFDIPEMDSQINETVGFPADKVVDEFFDFGLIFYGIFIMSTDSIWTA